MWNTAALATVFFTRTWVQSELAQAGIRPALLRALSWSAGMWLASLLLPVRVEVTGPVWATDLLGTHSGHIALGASAFAALTLFLLGLGGRTAPTSSRALMAMTATAVGLAGLLADADAQVALLPFLPPALSRGYVPLLVVVASSAAGLLARRAHRVLTFFGVALVALLALYLWPHPFGPLSQDTLQSTRAAIAPATELGRGVPLTQAALSGLPAALVGAALLVRRFAQPESQRVVAGWVLAALPATLVALGFKGAAVMGADSFVLVGLRAAALFLALTLTLTFAFDAFTAHAPSPGSRRFRLVGHGATLAALGLTLAPHLPGSTPERWALAAPPGWAPALYQHALPRIAIAAGQLERPGGLESLEQAVDEAAKTAAVPALAEAIRDLGRFAERPGRHRRRLDAVGERLNAAAQQAGLPYYVDLSVTGYRDGVDGVRWLLLLKTYRIERARRFSVAGRERSSLWLSRLDGTNVGDAQLGWTRHDAPEGMVLLGVIEEHWRQDLAPALAGLAGRGPRGRGYAHHARALKDDLQAALEGEVTPEELDELFECSRPDRGHRNLDCFSLRHRVEPEIVRVLAEKVEVHELQHAADGARIAPPALLLDAMDGYAEPSVRFAAAELSAYLAEIGSSRLPRLALAHFLALSEARPQSPEAFAGRVAFAALEDISGLPARALVDRPAEEVREVARAAYARLFGARLSAPVQIDPRWAPDPEQPAPPHARLDAPCVGGPQHARCGSTPGT